MTWRPFEGGRTIGTLGCEGGVILLDEEHNLGARITLERTSCCPYSITCGIYGSLTHTAFASTEEEANTKYTDMKERLETLVLMNWDGQRVHRLLNELFQRF
ncbi:hypothetical protein HZA57_08725 [Candidatus Poribacteria bacterium]|nr:hypothetical protein [Candidatus Poribacteria bacterium]